LNAEETEAVQVEMAPEKRETAAVTSPQSNQPKHVHEVSIEDAIKVSADSIPPPEVSLVDGISGFSPDSVAGARVRPDVLGTDGDARALARLICLEGASPLAIAVFGGWGAGKSSFMERIDWEVRQIARPTNPSPAGPPPNQARLIEHVVQIRFNDWQFVDANLWASLTAEFFDQLRAGGWDRQMDTRYAGLVERVNNHVHALNADLEAKRKVASDSARETAAAQKNRDQAAVRVNTSGDRILGQSVLNELRELYDSQRGNLSALGLATIGDDTTSSVEAILEALSASRSIGGQLRTIGSLFVRDRRRSKTVLAIAVALLVFAMILLVLSRGPWGGQLLTAGSSLALALLSAIGAVGTFAVALMPAIRFVNSVTRRGAEIAQRVNKADRDAAANLLRSEIKLREAIKETQALETAAEDASKRLARYVDPLSPANPPRLLRFVLEDDPDTQSLESQLGLIGRTRRLFQAVDDIVRKERAKAPSERIQDKVPDRVVIYIDDLDRCSEEQVYNVLQAIHLLLAFELFVVVVGVDVARVQTPLAKFADVDTDRSKLERATQYLEKIFQIAFWLPPLTSEGDAAGSYARYVKWVATAPTESGNTVDSAGDRSQGPSVRGFVTIILEPQEIEFLASSAIGRLAPSTPRGAKRLVNCYRLVRARLSETGVSVTKGENGPPLFPLVALMVALETGQSAEIAAFYDGIVRSKPGESLNQMILSTASVPENAPPFIQSFARALSTCEPLKNALDAVIQAQGGNLTVGELRPIAELARRFSFNRPPGPTRADAREAR
jgi:hypothetical protein